MQQNVAFAGTPVDVSVMGWILDHRTEPWIEIARVVTVLGNTATLSIIGAVVVVALLVTGHRSEAVFFGVGSLLGSVMMVVLKNLVARDRPPVDDRLLTLGSYSFPSGHAMMSMIVFGLLAIVAYRLSPWVRAHSWVMLAAPALSILLGLTRIYLGVHWTTDIVFGWLFGVAWVLLCVYVGNRVLNRSPERRLDSAQRD